MVRTVSLCLVEGQLAWFQSYTTYIPSGNVKVTSVGRLWATLENGYRCNRHTGEVDGGKYSSPGTVYCSEEEYRKADALLKMWRRLQRDVAGKVLLREDITRRHLVQVRRILRLDE